MLSGEYESLAELIRTSVFRELEGLHSQNRQAPQRDTGASEELMSALNELEENVSDIQTTVTHMDNQQSTEGELYDLSKILLQYAIPVPPADRTRYYAEYGITADEIASSIGADLETVEDALDNIINMTSRVERLHSNEKTVYIKRE